MLVEVALTPQVFDDHCNSDMQSWLRCIDEMSHSMFPRGAASPAIATNLQWGQWSEHVKRIADQIVDQNARWKVQGLVRQLKEIAVSRPGITDQPSDEQEWAKEAVASHRHEPIGRIVLTDSLCERFHPNGVQCSPIRDVQDAAFWSGIEREPVPMDIVRQVAMLRPLCVHAHYLALKLPHLHGLDDDETPFAAALFESIFRRPDQFEIPTVELHIDGEGLEGQRLANVLENIRQSFVGKVPVDTMINVYLWPHFADRMLIAGILTQSSGKPARSPRWGVGFNHIARPRDRQRTTGWALMSRLELDSHSRDLQAGSTLDRRKTIRI